MLKYNCEKYEYDSHNTQKSYYDSHIDKTVEKELNNKKTNIENEPLNINTDIKMTQYKLQKPFLKQVGGKTQIINDIITKTK